MKEIFYRRNAKNADDFFSSFEEYPLWEKYSAVINNLEKLKNEYLSKVENYLIENDLRNTNLGLFKKLIRSKKKIAKLKEVTDYKIDDLDFSQYNSLLVSYKEKQNTLLNKFHCLKAREVSSLKNILSDQDLLLSKNESLKKALIGERKLKNKDIVSLYEIYVQNCLKTRSFGIDGKTGLLIKDKDNWQLKKPDHLLILKINGAISSRIYKCVLKDNIKLYKGMFYVNRQFYEKDNNLIFSTLVDDSTSHLFSNVEKDISLKKTRNISKLLRKNEWTSEEILDFIPIKEIRLLIELGVLNYDKKDKSYDFTFVDLFKKDFVKLIEIKNELRKLNSHFDVNDVQKLLKKLEDACDFYDIKHNSIPLITIDTFLNEENQENVEIANSLESQLSTFDQISKLMSVYDSTNQVKKLATEYIKENYPKGISLKDNLRPLRNLGRYLISNSNIGKTKSGFITDDSLVDKIILSNQNSFVISERELNKYLSDKEVSRYHSYAFFIQKANEGFVVNHTYKGYGVFNRRYRNNYSDINFDESYGLENNIYDVDQQFGFNVNDRPINQKVSMAWDSTSGDININDLLVDVNKKSNELNFFYKDKVVHPNFLGSLTPLAYPYTLSVLNNLTLNGSLYFDLGDLVLRRKKELQREEITSPRIVYKDIILSRKKTLAKGDDVIALYEKSKDDLDFISKLIDKYDTGEEFYIREFIVDFKNYDHSLSKPVYISVNIPVSIVTLLRYCKKNDWIVFEEAIPNSKHEDKVEFILETGCD